MCHVLIETTFDPLDSGFFILGISERQSAFYKKKSPLLLILELTFFNHQSVHIFLYYIS